jgi:hypothetical protein
MKYAWGKKSICKNLVGKPKERNLLSDFDVDGRYRV